MVAKPKKPNKGEEIANFIRESGFILELETGEFLEKHGYQVDPTQYFFDAEEEKEREIDLIARKNINGITVCLIVECKQNLGDDWVFVSTQKNPTHYYNELKHSPKIPTDVLKANKPYTDLHIYNFKAPLAQNYLVYKKEKGNRIQASSKQIEECLHKLPKALVWIARNEAKTPTIYLPVALFSGNIFEASYKEKLLVKERMLVQFQTILNASAYYDKPDLTLNIPTIEDLVLAPGETRTQAPPVPKIDPDARRAKASAKRLSKEYTIDIINKKGLKRYLSLIEKEINLMDVSLWPLPKSSTDT